MIARANQWIIFTIIISGILLFSWEIQNHLILNSDVSCLTYAASKLLLGGTYSNDFFEINPPLIIYLYTPVVLLKQMMSINTFSALQIYVATISFISLFLCFSLLSL